MSGKKGLYFTKMQGAGNDYVYIDALGRKESVIPDTLNLPALARRISDRHFGVGGDGLILIMPSDIADFRMRMYNADGTEAQMCGNGARCVAKYVHDKGFTDKTHITLETLSGIKEIELHLRDGVTVAVTVDMGKAALKRRDIPARGEPDSMMKGVKLTIEGKEFEVTGVGMGNPHGVIFVDEITDHLICHYGRLLEKSDIWPERANIEFVKIKDRSHIEMRVWERGTGETLACGTGACASVVAACIAGLTTNNVEVKLLGGSLDISYDSGNGHVYMTGPAEFVAEGIYLNYEETAIR